jgi:nucleotide-binding universal stress UspA family protein
MQLERIVIGMDFSASAIEAAGWIAHSFAPDAELVLVHAIVVPEIPRFLRQRTVPPDTLVETARLGAEQRMRELAATLGAKLVWPEIRVGTPAEQIVQVCKEYDADLIVVGPHGERTGGWGERLGSTAERLVRTAPTPVLLTTHLRDAVPRRILVPVDDSSVTPWVVRWARALASRFGAASTAIYVIGPAVFSSALSMASVGTIDVGPEVNALRSELRDDAHHWIARAVRDNGDREPITTDVVFGDPGAQIVGIAQRTNIDLIVMGSRGLKGMKRMLLGSVASHVLRHAPCPTLVVKEPEDEIVDDDPAHANAGGHHVA